MNKDKKELIPKKTKYIAFFGFYAVFFAVLLIMINIGDNKTVEEKEEVIDTYTNSIAANYKFMDKYTISSIFTLNEQVIELDKDSKILSEVPIINQVIKNSKFTIKENNDNGFTNNYEIDNSTLYNILYDSLDEGDDSINYITLSIDESGLVTNVSYELSSFYQKLDSNNKSSTLIIKFE